MHSGRDGRRGGEVFGQRAFSCAPGSPSRHRGAFFFDLDNGGDPGIFKVNSDLSRLFRQEDQVFENLGEAGNRDAIGGRVKVTVVGPTRVAEKRSSGGYLFQNDPRLLFGLGGSEKTDRAEVAWPSGRTQVLENVPGGKTVTFEGPAR